jgi:transposase-like protein
MIVQEEVKIMGKHRSFSPGFKTQVVLQLISGEKTRAELCREHRISSQQLGNWKKKFLDNASSLFESKRQQDEEAEQIAELERMVGRLTMQLEIAKKASSILTLPLTRNGRS